MRYGIELMKSAAKALSRIPKKDRKRISEKIDSFAEHLPAAETTKMKGDNPFHKVRVGNYRIIYEINDDVLQVLIIKIGHRKDVYRKI